MVEQARPVRTSLGYYGTCTYCCRTNIYLTRDHVVPTSRGGAKNRSNIVFACVACNQYKGNYLLSELPKDWPERAVRVYEANMARQRGRAIAKMASGPSMTYKIGEINYADAWASVNVIKETRDST